ncbi:hypothetical protein OPIT5_24285 [Opitutaceae bacterium TAV5]|nr:hypothetical protein OPIT5_24285 [Opitutaceae bacterium TAV5]
MHIKSYTRNLFAAPAVVALAALLAISAARAIVIDFEAGSGYSTTGGASDDGRLVGQPSGSGQTTWTSAAAGNALIIVENGANGQVLQTTQSGSGGSSYVFASSSADLGGDFNSTKSILSFGFTYRLDDTPRANLALLRFGIGTASGPVIQVEIMSNGRVNYGSGTTYTIAAKDSLGATFLALEGAWVTISGEVNFSTNTYTLTVNGVQQLNSVGGSAFDFRANATDASRGAGILLTAREQANENWIPVSLDSISLSLIAIPEPSSAGMALTLVVLAAAVLARVNFRK